MSGYRDRYFVSVVRGDHYAGMFDWGFAPTIELALRCADAFESRHKGCVIRVVSRAGGEAVYEVRT